MNQESNPTTSYKQVVVDVPEDRLAEFHAFFARFLAGRRGPGRRGRHGAGHRHHGIRARACGRGVVDVPADTAKTGAPTGRKPEVTEA
jgi:hypothetical protein